jgi:hypothetical protein
VVVDAVVDNPTATAFRVETAVLYAFGCFIAPL